MTRNELLILRGELLYLARKFCRKCKTAEPRKSNNGWWHHVLETPHGQYLVGCGARHIHERLQVIDAEYEIKEAIEMSTKELAKHGGGDSQCHHCCEAMRNIESLKARLAALGTGDA